MLPPPQNFLVPPMQVPKASAGRAMRIPTVASGLKIEKIADGLQHPRQLLTLPNGDVLVVESNGPGTEAGHHAQAADRRPGQEPLGQGRQGRQPHHAAAQAAARANGSSMSSSSTCIRLSACS